LATGVRIALALVGALTTAEACGEAVPALPERARVTLDSLSVDVGRDENRAVSFTNRRSAFYYTQTHRNDHPEHAWFRGLSIAGRRVFSDYRVSIGGETLDPALSTSVTVAPDALVRRHPPGTVETLRLYDDEDVVGVEIDGAPDTPTLALEGEMVRELGADGGLHFYESAGDSPGQAPLSVAVGRADDVFLVCSGTSREAATSLCARAAREEPRWRAGKRARLERMLNGDQYVLTDDPRLTASLRWIALTTDQLVTRQRGDGIYAGLPWFQEYWGRDSFIALPGATLVTGRFEEARAVLTSFAKFQDLDPESPFYGRLPNIVKPGSLDYHTTDGTPRFVIALGDYLRYTGDASLVRELYPNVVASIEGSMRRFTDARGLLVHADNETWMDARREPDLVAYAPRGTRANDIQALWYGQLRTGAGFAARLGDRTLADRWNAAADAVRSAFAEEFAGAGGPSGPVSVADHVTASGHADRSLRPNVLFALPLLPEAEAAAVTARVWSTLVFPWGVATLDPADPGFHPYHVAPGCWHKDAAYHNGTVWPWLDGVFVDALLRFGQVEPAWRLFLARSRLALERGVVGGLPETLDAHPRPGATEPRLTGTYLQAWSNAEHLRAWYQDFLGLRPELDEDRVVLRPRLPRELRFVDVSARVGPGSIRGVYERTGSLSRYQWRLSGLATQLSVDIHPFDPRSFPLRDGERLVAEDRGDALRVSRVRGDGKAIVLATLRPSPERLAQQRGWDASFARAGFARPRPAGELAIRCTLPAPHP
jgi:glycogen debranching enzyme